MAHSPIRHSAHSDEHVEFMVARYYAGKSCSEIAREVKVKFGLRKTRNAVIGLIYRDRANKEKQGIVVARRDAAPPSKVGRTPLPPRAWSPERPRVALAWPHAPILPPDQRAPVVTVRQDPPSSEARTMQGLTGCRYPVGSALGEDQLFCNAPRREGRTYCDTHHVACHAPREVCAKKPKSHKGWDTNKRLFR